MKHIPVLLHEVIEGLFLRRGKRIVDGTINGGGHSKEIVKQIMPEGELIGIDRDGELVENTQRTLKELYPSEKIKVYQGSYADIKEVLAEKLCDGIVLDLGFSSLQIEDKRGFSFDDEVLDMRYDKERGEPAYQILNTYEKDELVDIFFKYGEEHQARHIAEKICNQRKEAPITKASELSEVISEVYRRRYKTYSKKHPATKVFQALRIETNKELFHLETFLKVFPDVLKEKGRCVIISFHSLEDRMVKQAFREHEREEKGVRITKKPSIPTREEMQHNPRSRSAKLRIFEKT